MKKKLYILLMPLLAIIFSGCEGNSLESTLPDGMGELCLRAGMSTEISIPVITKVADFGDIPVEDLYILVMDNSDNSVVLNKTYGELLKGSQDDPSAGLPIILPQGEYTVQASTHEKREDVLDSPYFMARNEAVIIDEKRTSTVELKCTFQSIGVELVISDQFKQLMEEMPEAYSYKVSVSNGLVTWSFDPENMNPGYFQDTCEELIVKVQVRLGSTNDWYPERIWRVTNKGYAPRLGEYYIINLDASKTPEATPETISLKSSLLTE